MIEVFLPIHLTPLRVNLGVVAMKEYSTFRKSLKESFHIYIYVYITGLPNIYTYYIYLYIYIYIYILGDPIKTEPIYF